MPEPLKTRSGNAVDLPKGYRMTELGPLPEEWTIVKLGEIATVKSGGTAPQGVQYFLNGQHPFVRVQHLDTNSDYVQRWDLITNEAVHLYRLRKFPAGTIVFPKSGASIRLEKRAILPTDAYLVSHLCAVLPKENKVERQFLLYNLKAQKLSKEKSGSYPVLNLSEIKNLLLYLPPLPEQRAIAHVLRTVQEAKEATERNIAAARELKKSLMRYLFTHGPVPIDQTNRIPLKETEIGPLPENWKVVRLGEVFEIQQGKALSRKRDKGIRPRPFLRTANVLWGKIDLSSLDEMDFSPEEQEKYALRKDDLLVCEGGEVGRTAIWEGQLNGVYYQNHLHRLRRKVADIEPRFYMYWLEMAITLLGLYGGASNKTTIPNLSQSRLAAFPIPLAPLPEQRQIAEILQAVDRKIEAEENRKTALEELLKSLLHELMTAKRRLPKEFIAQFADKPGEKPENEA